ncbi:uncharacterized protein K452DRAFT_294393 [Aplosporella prunicola CBS 121167]|uniref:Uncharacterized protein n=1 Tax=Aplosporella prunicola CBS 121167 TaxID=1176127 RepID=A0A6A6BUB9_9PEZI|nr:uncharacterized protein K452DRAFT_294393 [Aplosporella prunicola CBS 121167]KAF2146865.1 hypothetical protein K452DRAFT_294393 [Aplosporella prunicola CBS 121167]
MASVLCFDAQNIALTQVAEYFVQQHSLIRQCIWASNSSSRACRHLSSVPSPFLISASLISRAVTTGLRGKFSSLINCAFDLEHTIKEQNAGSKDERHYAFNSILTRIGTNLQPKFIHYNDPFSLWVALKTRFDDEGLSHGVDIINNFIMLVSSDYPSITEYITAFRKAKASMDYINCNLDDRFYCLIFLNQIDKDMPIWVTVICKDWRDGKVPHIDTLLSQTFNEARRIFDSRPAVQPVKQTDSYKDRRRCQHCGGRHSKVYCYYLHPKKRPTNWRPRRTDVECVDLNTDSSTKSSIDNIVKTIRNLQLAASRIAPAKQHWVVNSVAHDHFTGLPKSAFDSHYKPLSTPMPIPGLGGTKHAVARGSVSLTCSLQDGNTIRISFSNVLHIPNQPFNVLSLDRLQAKSVSLFNEDLRSIADNRLISHCDVKNNLYFLRSANKPTN